MPECNLCGATRFLDIRNRPNVRCASCGSLERTRLLWLYIARSGILNPGARVLHFAPERGLSTRIRSIVGEESYRAVDFDPAIFKTIPGVERFDLTSDVAELEDDSLDLVVQSHVMEHVACNLAFPLFHLHRALKPTGLHACVIPFSRGRWDESFDPGLPEETRVRRFGQNDHVRKIGREDAARTVGKIIDIERYTRFDASADFPAETLRRFNIPESMWTGLTASTPLMLRKSD